MSVRDTLYGVLDRETATTLKVLRAYPAEKSELKPHEVCKSARELAWMFTLEQQLAIAAMQDTLDLSGGFPPAPEDWNDVVAAFEKSRADILATLKDADLDGTVQFFTGPGTMGDYAKPDFLWFLIHDQIHHRGQFSIYLRMAEGKVPSIYGPSHDEPWF